MTADRTAIPSSSGPDGGAAPAPAIFEATIDLEGSRARVDCSGDLNNATSDILRDALWLAMDHASRSLATDGDAAGIELDLRAVRLCCGDGIDVITEAFRDAAERGIVVLASLSLGFGRILED